MTATALGLILAACDEAEENPTPPVDPQATADAEVVTDAGTEPAEAVVATDGTAVAATASAETGGAAYGDMVMGDPNAPITVIEYASMTCSHCARFHAETLPELEEKYIETGKVKYVFRNFLLNRVDLAASTVIRCQGEDQFFPLTNLFFARQKDWLTENAMDDLAALARRAGISRAEFDRCIADRDLQKHIVEMTQAGQQEFEITGTPTIIIDGEKQAAGAADFEELDRILQSKL